MGDSENENPEANEDAEKLDELQDKSSWELKEMLRDFAESPAGQALTESSTPRIYVTFQQNCTRCPVDAQGVSKPAKATFGPYIDIAISDDRMHVTASPSDPTDFCEPCCLATWDGEGWTVHDGLEDSAPLFHWIRFHTFKQDTEPA